MFVAWYLYSYSVFIYGRALLRALCNALNEMMLAIILLFFYFWLTVRHGLSYIYLHICW